MDAEDLARVRREAGVEQPRQRLAGPQATMFERRLAGPGGRARPLSPRAMSEALPEAGPFRIGPETEAPRPSDIQRELAEALGVPVRVGKLGRGKLLRSALGIYKPRARVVRLARAGDITTLGHEMGHDLHALMFGTVKGGLTDDQLALLPGAVPAEIDRLARGISDGSLAEGWAEFWRRYIDNPDVLPAQAPELLRYVEGRFDELNGVRGALQKARDDWRIYREAGPEARFDAKIATKDEPRTATIDDALYRLRRDVIDDMTGLERVQEAILGGAAPKSLDEDAITLARLARGAADEAETFLERGIIDFNTREISGNGLRQILEPVADRIDQFRNYATARRVQELHSRDIESGFRIDDANEIMRRYDADPEMRAAFDELQQYNDGLLRYLRDSGVLGEETYALIRERNLNYVPFYRVLDNDRALGGGSKTFGHIFSPTKKIKGSGRDVIDPLESLIKNTYLYVATARRQQVSNALAQLAEHQGAGRFIEQLPAPIKPVQLSLGQAESAMRKKLAETLGDEAVQELERLPKEVADEMLTVFQPGDYFRKENIISVLRDGKRVWYEVDPELYRALTALNSAEIGVATQLLSIPARTLRAGAILAPEFMGRNPFRDQLWAYITSESGYKPFLDLARGMSHYLGKSDTFWRWKSSGGASSALTSMDRKAMRRTLESLTDTPGDRVANVIKNPIEGLRALGELMEYSTRLGEYARAEANLADLGAREAQAYAGLASREIGTDYARHGGHPATQAVRLITAFWNARLQGYDRLFRRYKEAPLEVTSRAITGITLPSLLLYAVNRDDPEYWEIPLWQRNLFWLVKMPNGTWLRFPKPFEPGLVFGSVPERLLEWADTQDHEAVTKTMRELVAGTGLVQLPQAISPFVENLTNYSFFLGRPIVPRGLEEVEPKYQVTQRTSEAAKWAGRLTGLSPLKIDNLYQSWTGGLGRIASEAATGAIRTGRRLAGEEVPSEPAPTAADIPGLRGFVARTPGVSSESIERFYDELADAREARRTMRFLAESRQPEEARRLVERRQEEIARLPQLETAGRTLSELRAALDVIRRDPNMTPDEKRERIDRIGREMTRVAASAIQRKLPAAAEYAGR